MSWSTFNSPVKLSSLLRSGQAIRIGGGRSSSGGGGSPASIVQNSMNSANQANDARYNQALSIYDQMLANTGTPYGGRAPAATPPRGYGSGIVNGRANESGRGQGRNQGTDKSTIPRGGTTGTGSTGGAGTGTGGVPTGTAGFSFGQLENQLLDQNVLAQKSNLEQDLFSRGLGNTTIVNSMLSGIDQRANLNRLAIADAVARQRNDILMGQAGVIERRNDLGPDLGLFADLQRAASGAPTGAFQAPGRASGSGGGGGYQPSVFGGGFTTPSRGTSSAGGSRGSQGQGFTSTAHQSQYQLQQQQQNNAIQQRAREQQAQWDAAAAARAQYNAAREQAIVNTYADDDYDFGYDDSAWRAAQQQQAIRQTWADDDYDLDSSIDAALDDYWSSIGM